jgi:hypothetical protein
MVVVEEAVVVLLLVMEPEALLVVVVVVVGNILHLELLEPLTLVAVEAAEEALAQRLLVALVIAELLTGHKEKENINGTLCRNRFRQ